MVYQVTLWVEKSIIRGPIGNSGIT